MRKWIHDHGLLVANAGLFVVFFGAMVASGMRVYNADQLEHGQSAVTLAGYLTSGDFVEATFENWESEFLQMGMYRRLDRLISSNGARRSPSLSANRRPQDEDPRTGRGTSSMHPGRCGAAAGSWPCTNRSLSILFFVFVPLASLALHAAGGAKAYSAERAGSRRLAGHVLGISRYVAVLVRVVPELAK